MSFFNRSGPCAHPSRLASTWFGGGVPVSDPGVRCRRHRDALTCRASTRCLSQALSKHRAAEFIL